ncbi:kinase-like protein [Gigaspora margarita]|uniref:Kinase-like protein n=1 Tax=Gigaspora margarita TaxID=4874 RepID=A0A8H3X8P6_GIGMA|nr:kinase-like protein [Gigaspora margarita]
MVYSEKWLENTINEGRIKFYGYNESSALEQIGKGGFGTVYKSEWKNHGSTIALKELNITPLDKKTIQRFIKELKNLQKVCEHPNIIKFYGVTRDRDRPNGFYNMKSDIYSFGVILWEISSGRPPFQLFKGTKISLCVRISNGEREEPIEGTPDSYRQLYQRCWDSSPDMRPELDELLKQLRDIPEKETIDEYNDNMYLNDTSKPDEIMLRISNLDIKASPVMHTELNETSRLKDLPVKETIDDTSRLDKIMLRISNLDMKSPIYSNNDSEEALKAIRTIIRILFKSVDDLFIEHFLNAGRWLLPHSRDARERGIGPFIQILFNLSYDLCHISFFFYSKQELQYIKNFRLL